MTPRHVPARLQSSRRHLHLLLLLAGALFFACRPSTSAERPAAPKNGGGARNALAVDTADPGPVPLDAQSARWGDETAPVTVVEFSDLQCPFCARVQPALTELKVRYGPQKLRIVWVNDPLPFHANARGAALAAQAVRELGGDTRFFEFVRTLFEDQQALTAADLHRAATSVGVAGASFDVLVRSHGVAEKVDRDLDLVRRAGVTGTPHFLVNGIVVSGAVPVEDFASVIDAELAETTALISKGTPPARLYALRTKTNFQAPKEAPEEAAPEEHAYNVPVGASPRLGPDDALVTIIEFSDFECPYCKRVQPTLVALRERYGKDLRIVWKQLPLPFHQHARAAATFSIEARRALGDAGFWKAVDLLFGTSPALDDDSLLGVAKLLGLDWTKIARAIASDADAPVLSEDEGAAADFEVRGTPHFFINGQRLVGAQPLEAFAAVVDAELDRARKLVASGTPRARVFDEVMRTAEAAPAPEVKDVPAPQQQNPSRGPTGAKITIQMFADFECPYCRRAMRTLDELEKRHPNQIRLVYRNLPLEFHTGARRAAEAALEAFEQKGAEAFWKMAALLESDQDDRAPLTNEELTKHAKALGLDVPRFEQAVAREKHGTTIDADVALATRLGIQGTPSFTVNGYYISGAQPLAVFERAVQRSLAANPPSGTLRAK